MFLKKLKDTRPDVLDRIRRQRSLSPSIKIPTDTPVPPFVTHRSTSTDKHDESESFLHALCEIFHIAPEAMNRERVLQKARVIEADTQLIRKVLSNIKEYEEVLRLITDSERSPCGEMDLQLDELVRRAFSIAREADKQYRSQLQELVGFRKSLACRIAEVHSLRAKNSQLEDSILKSKIDILRSTCGTVDKSDDQRQAVDTLVAAVKDSEARRVLAEQELIKTKSALREIPNACFANESPNLFVEIAELRELVRELTMKLYQAEKDNPPSALHRSRPACSRQLEIESEKANSVRRSISAELEHESLNPTLF